MDDVFKGWRRKCGIGTLLAALVLTGAWVKSAVDHDVIDRSMENQADSLSLSGKVGVFVMGNPIEWSGHLPETHWRVTGLYTDANITIAPEQVRPRLPDPVPRPDAEVAELKGRLPSEWQQNVAQFNATQLDEETVVLANYSEVKDPTGLPLIQTGASQSVAELNSLQRPRVGITFESGFPQSDIDGVSDKAYDDDGTITVQRRWCGFQFEQVEAADGAGGTMVLIPHWFIVLPLWLLSAVLLIGSRLGQAKNAPVVAESATVRAIGVERNQMAGDFFKGWRRKWGVVTLFTSLVLAGGWVRSSVVTDHFMFSCPIGTGARIRLVSGKEGMVCEHDPTPISECTSTDYRMLTGRAHDTLTVRPMGSMEVLQGMQNMGSFELADSSDVANPEGDPEEPPPLLAAMPQTAGESGQMANSQVVANAPVAANAPGVPDSGATDWVGTHFDWGGLYLSSGSTGTTVAVPYGFLVIPLTLLSAVLLVWPRTVKAKNNAIGGSSSGVGT